MSSLLPQLPDARAAALAPYELADTRTQLMGMIMVKRDWASDSLSAEAAFSRVKKDSSPLWLVSYLEGTRISDSKIAQVRSLQSTRIQSDVAVESSIR